MNLIDEPKISIEQWLSRNFHDPNSRPTTQCVRNWINRGQIRGMRIGKTYWIFEKWYVPNDTKSAKLNMFLNAVVSNYESTEKK